eukprot:3552136-Amphidinium_carterae.2
MATGDLRSVTMHSCHLNNKIARRRGAALEHLEHRVKFISDAGTDIVHIGANQAALKRLWRQSLMRTMVGCNSTAHGYH